MEEQTAQQDLSPETATEVPEQQGEAQPEQKVKTLPEDMLDATYKVMIDGEEHNLTVRELARLQSLEKASQNRFKQAAEMNKKIEDFVEHAKKDPEAALRKLGYDPEDFSTKYIEKKIREMQMSPEQREEEQRRSKFEEEKAQWEQQVNARIAEEIDQGMTQAFQKVSLPRSPFFAARMAGLVAQSLEKSKNGQGEPLSYEEAAVKVKQWFQNANKETLSQMEPKAILDFLGPEIAKKLQTAFVQHIEGGTVPTAESGSAVKKAVPKKPNKTFKHWKDYHAYIDSL